MGKDRWTFFCDNCGSMSISSKRKVRITKDNSEIVSDTCSQCGVTQEIESKGEEHIDTRRIKNG